MKKRMNWPPRCEQPGCQNTRLPMGPYLCSYHLESTLANKKVKR